MLGRLSARLSRKPGLSDYVLALGFSLLAVACRALLELVAPGIGYFVIILPAVVLAGIFCGTSPAVMTALVGGAGVASLLVTPSLTAWPPFNSTQLDMLIYVPACAAVIGATATVRLFARNAEVARVALETSIARRDLLVREADHRIKNSLQLVTSLLRLQIGRSEDQAIKTALLSAVARVDAVADAHLALQVSSDLRTIEVNQMCEDLCRRLGSLNPNVTMRCHSRLELWLDAEQGKRPACAV